MCCLLCCCNNGCRCTGQNSNCSSNQNNTGCCGCSNRCGNRCGCGCRISGCCHCGFCGCTGTQITDRERRAYRQGYHDGWHCGYWQGWNDASWNRGGRERNGCCD